MASPLVGLVDLTERAIPIFFFSYSHLCTLLCLKNADLKKNHLAETENNEESSYC